MRRRWRKVVLPVGLSLLAVAATLAAYLPALDAGFYFDDLPNIVEAPALHWTSLSLAGFEGLAAANANARRPVANLSFALNHLAGGLEPRGYHLVNLLIHLAAGAALVWVSWLLSREGSPPPRRARRALPAAVVAASLFMVHPLDTQAVTYVVQRMSSLAALFFLLALGGYLKGRLAGRAKRRRRWLAFAAAAWLLALGCKETALLLPLVIFTYEACFHRETWRRRWRRLKSDSRRHRLSDAAAALAASGLAVGFLAAYAGGTRLSLTGRFPNRDFNGVERVLTQSRVQLFYFGLLSWPSPSRLNLDHEFTVSRGLAEPATTLPAVVFWGAAAAVALLLGARRPRWGFPLLAYMELHLLESGPLNLELVFEHRMYLPMTALAWLLAALLTDLPASGRRLATAAAALLVLPLAGATRERNLTWSDPVAFHQDCARKSPHKFRPQYNLGTVLGELGRVREALPALERAVALDPEHSEARNQLANALLLTGRPREALVQYLEAVRLDPGNVESVFNLAMLLDRQGDHDEAVIYYRRFLDLAPPRLAPHAARVRQRLRTLVESGED